MMTPDLINIPSVVGEITRLFWDYEAAFLRNDAEALSHYFWDSEAMTRYGVCDKQLGHAAMVAYRRSVPTIDFTRELLAIRINTFGPDMAVAMTEFKRSDTSLHGFQTQTWVRLPQGWKIVSAHVSMVPTPLP
jgi:Protein of unknown function (DUF3225)